LYGVENLSFDMHGNHQIKPQPQVNVNGNHAQTHLYKHSCH